MIYTHKKYNLPKIRYTFPVADIEVSRSHQGQRISCFYLRFSAITKDLDSIIYIYSSITKV